MSNNINFGVEIECYINTQSNNYDWLSENKRGYHNRSYNGELDWRIEWDSSLSEFDDDWVGFEFISPILTSEAKLQSALRHWFDCIINDRDPEDRQDFDDVIMFNRYCGCHIHFSMSDWYNRLNPNYGSSNGIAHNVIPYHYLIGLKNRYDRWLSAYDKEQYACYTRQYYRNYADRYGRYSDYNNEQYSERRHHFTILTGNTGIEWRGFNLQGVRNYSDIKNRLETAFLMIQDLLIGDTDKLYPVITTFNLPPADPLDDVVLDEVLPIVELDSEPTHLGLVIPSIGLENGADVAITWRKRRNIPISDVSDDIIVTDWFSSPIDDVSNDIIIDDIFTIDGRIEECVI